MINLKENKIRNVTTIFQCGNVVSALELGRDKDFYNRFTH